MASTIRPNVLRMSPYVTGKPIDEVKREFGLHRVIKLASNENPLGPSPKAVAAVQEAATKMHVYPDGGAYDLKQAISKKFGVSTKEIMVGNGSDGLIHTLGLVFLGNPEDELLMGDPSFSRYDAAAHLAPAQLVKVPLDSDYRHDLKAMRARVTENTKMVWIANPNNPTGTLVRKAEVDAFLADLPEHVIVVLDEAYYEFAAGAEDFPVSTDYIAAGKNVIGLRTFSKAYGLAGIRVGYGFAPAWVIDAIDRAREPFDVNSLAQVAAIAALDDDEHMHATVANNTKGLEFLAKVFTEVGARPMESYANFVFADLGRSARPVFDALLRRGIITRPGDALGNPTSLRVSVGTEEELEAFATEFRIVMSGE